MPEWVLDTSVLLTGREPPPGTWWTTPEADAEVSPGGRDARRYAAWKDVGLRVAAAPAAALDAVEAAARDAGNLARLSGADRSLAALALDRRATLVSDDRTLLDVAARLGIATLSLGGHAIEGTKDWRPRCSGCGRWFDADPGPACPVCGSRVQAKPLR